MQLILLCNERNGFLCFSFCGLDTTPVVVTSGMTMAQKRAFKAKGMALDTNALKEHQANRRGFLLFSFYSSASNNS